MKAAFIVLALAAVAFAQDVADTVDAGSEEVTVESGFRDGSYGWNESKDDKYVEKYDEKHNEKYDEKYDDKHNEKYDVKYESGKYDDKHDDKDYGKEDKKDDSYTDDKKDSYDDNYDADSYDKKDEHHGKRSIVPIRVLKCPTFKHCNSEKLRSLGKVYEQIGASGTVCSWQSNTVSCNLSLRGSKCTYLGYSTKKIACDKHGQCEPVMC